jgi:hypothetical protein
VAYSETPFSIGKALAALACDKRMMRKSGQALVSGKLAREYDFTEIDGTQPIWSYGSVGPVACSGTAHQRLAKEGDEYARKN